MTDGRWHEIWKEQCEAAEAILFCYGVESAFDYVVGEKLLKLAEAASEYPEIARALPRFASTVRRMFTPQEMEEQLARIERLRPELQEAPREERDSAFESPKQVSGRARQFELLRQLLMPPILATS